MFFDRALRQNGKVPIVPADDTKQRDILLKQQLLNGGERLADLLLGGGEKAQGLFAKSTEHSLDGAGDSR